MSVVSQKKIATRQAYGEALVELGERNPDVVVLDADLSKSTYTYKFAERFPERFFNVGIAEANMMGIAAGLALAGKIPFASTFAIFGAGRAYDQVRNAIGYSAVNVKICVSHGGITLGEDGASHQMIEDLALMRAIPNMTVIVPADAVEARAATFAVAEHPGPCYVRLGRPAVPVVLPEDYEFRIGRAATLREGRDVAIIACGVMVAPALEAAEALAAEGIGARVINMSTIKPLDVGAVIRAAEECGAIVTAEEHNVLGGLGGAVAEVVADQAPVPVKRVGVRDVFGESGRPDELLKKYGLTAEDIAEAARAAIARRARAAAR
ncbi:transketolase family protein [Caldinitratiruptor microaerophilus]|uniref:Transketolase n=1 Tax=Caldinitratiruptor microaerophilus TaxID=671077 RepID=A0AA35CM68_9FIRM|nr:transketolase family protein [Caldinitratiruptor microaerophilus]BDG61702.1 transketolase [Caldinitratiruptor microaerophilus]